MSEKPRTARTDRPIQGKKPALPQAGGEISLEEIRDVLEDDGYSANRRKAWLKEILTELQDNRAKPQSPDRDDLIQAVKDIIADHQETPPISDDAL